MTSNAHSLVLPNKSQWCGQLFDVVKCTRYTRIKSLPSRRAGCESPMARGAKPHPARFAAFLFQHRLGGSNGRARALPVTLRVPRPLTPVRAAAQCESWSAVVHQAQLEINMTNASRRATALAFPTIQRNTFNAEPCKFTRLPFVADVKTAPRRLRRSFWAVPDVECTASANALGEQYAADWIQFLKQNPEWIGAATTAKIAREMYTTEANESSAIAVGFWCLIEKVLIAGAQHVDVYGIAEAAAKRLKPYALQSNEGVRND